VACLDVAAGRELVRHVSALERYAREAWLRCGPFDAGTPHP
jgi:hypothetical protein